jgi:hypothetical protein
MDAFGSCSLSLAAMDGRLHAVQAPATMLHAMRIEKQQLHLHSQQSTDTTRPSLLTVVARSSIKSTGKKRERVRSSNAKAGRSGSVVVALLRTVGSWTILPLFS